MSKSFAIMAEYETPPKSWTRQRKCTLLIAKSGMCTLRFQSTVWMMLEADNAKVGYFTFFGGLIGFTTGMTMQYL